MDAKTIMQMSQAELSELVRSAGDPVRKFEYANPRWIPPTVDQAGIRHPARYLLPRGAVRCTAQAAVGVDISSVTATVFLEGILGLVAREFTLRNIMAVQMMPQLLGTIPVGTKGTAKKDVPAGVAALYTPEAYTSISFDLTDHKDVYHVPVLDEDVKKARVDIVGNTRLVAAMALAQAENEKAAAVIETDATTLAGGDWASVNPIENIVNVSAILQAATGYKPNVVGAHPLAWSDYFGSSYIKGLAGVQWPASNVFALPGLPGFTGVMEIGLTSTKAYVGSSVAGFGLGDGPTEAEQYRIADAGASVYIIKHWNFTKRLLADASRMLTGVHA